jgi:hypothetical protein
MKLELRRFLLTCPLALLTLIIPLIYGDDQFLTVVALMLISVLMLLVERSARYLAVFAIVLISGPIAEAIAIYFGAWSYASPVFLGFPAWLPLVWGNAALYIVRLKALVYSFR